MIHSIGQILRQTREKRGLSLDEAAHATKLRPDKIVALETGDYASFPSNAYARGFLQIYGRYLRVDVSGEAAALDTTNRITVADYQYLSAPSGPRQEPERNLPDLGKRKKTSFMPLLVGFGLVVVAFFGFSAYVNWQRITGDLPRQREAGTPEPAALPEPAPAAAVAAVAAVPAPPPVAETPATPDPVAMAPRPAISDREFLGAPASTEPVATEPLVPVPNPDRDLIAATPVQMNDVEVSVVKKTWVRIRRDDANAAPIFEDYLYPGLRPLKLRGTRILIEARDPGVVAIRKNGDPIAYQAPGVMVQ